MVRVKELRKNTVEAFEKSGIEEARADTDYLLSYIAGLSRSDIIFGEGTLDGEAEESFYNAVKRRINGEPVQYIAGICEFMSLELEVNSSTLIPRADTEVLVEECIKIIRENKLKTLLDIGTGSGCVGISAAYYCKEVKPYMLDISAAALETAGRNLKRHGLADRARLLNVDIMSDKAYEISPEEGIFFDLIVSNPPYIKTEEISSLDTKVKNFEPHTALDGGKDGLEFYRRITELSAQKAKYLAFEIGFDQEKEVREIMKAYFKDIQLVYDYGGNPRVLTGKNIQI